MQCTVKVAGVLALVLLSSQVWAASTEADSVPDNGTENVARSVLSPGIASSERPVSNRLRFRSNGPVCMCGDGLRERDIRRAESDAPQDNNRVEKQ